MNWQSMEAADKYEASLGDLPPELEPRPDIPPDRMGLKALRASRTEFSQQIGHIGSIGLGPSIFSEVSRLDSEIAP